MLTILRLAERQSREGGGQGVKRRKEKGERRKEKVLGHEKEN
jgi:hypothetical protein